MTDSEAIARFKSCQENVGNCGKCRFYSCCGIYDMEDLAIEALKEVQEYRKIGTPEELKAASKYLRLVKKHGTVGKTIEECAEYEEIGTVEECREAMEKQRRKIVKNQYGTNYVLKAGYCPVCGCGVTARWDYCQCCGQKLNWQV